VSAERNWAEHDARLRDNPTEAEAAALARSHRGYGWSMRPWGHWPENVKAAYEAAYQEAAA
jgi:hypothetical protein